jgi:hypothetical protein
MMGNYLNTIQRLIFGITPVLCLFFTAQGVCLGQKVILSGRVIAFENSAVRIARLTDVPRVETFFVKVESVSKGNETSKFIKVKYRYFGDENALPESLFEGKKHWKFVLLRNRECDQTGITENPAVTLVTIDGGELISPGSAFPCYTLAKEGLKKASKG